METVLEIPERTHEACNHKLVPVKDALEILSGKWKLQIIISVSFGAKRFKQISKEIDGITDRMLSKELKDLEINQLIKRTVHETFPPTVEYSITDHGKSLEKVIAELHKWGSEHRKRIMSVPQEI
jgi:DNA-binding HxlR family transcriptional regulator